MTYNNDIYSSESDVHRCDYLKNDWLKLDLYLKKITNVNHKGIFSFVHINYLIVMTYNQPGIFPNLSDNDFSVKYNIFLVDIITTCIPTF